MNGAAIGIAPSEIDRMTWWQYHGIVSTYNERNTPAGEETVEAPDPDFVARRLARLADAGIGAVPN